MENKIANLSINIYLLFALTLLKGMAVQTPYQINPEYLEIFKREAISQFDEDKEIDFIRLRYGSHHESSLKESSRINSTILRVSSVLNTSNNSDGELKRRQMTLKLNRLEQQFCKVSHIPKPVNREQRVKQVAEENVDTRLIQAQKKITHVLNQTEISDPPHIAQIKRKLTAIYKKSLLLRRESIKGQKKAQSIKNEIKEVENQIIQIDSKIDQTKLQNKDALIMKNKEVHHLKEIAIKFKQNSGLGQQLS